MNANAYMTLDIPNFNFLLIVFLIRSYLRLLHFFFFRFSFVVIVATHHEGFGAIAYLVCLYFAVNGVLMSVHGPYTGV